MFSLRSLFALIFLLLLNPLAALAQSYYSSSSDSSSGSSGVMSNRGPPGHFVFVADYNQHFVSYTSTGYAFQQSPGSSSTVGTGNGTGYSVGFEFDSPSTTLTGLWIFGLYYNQEVLNITPNLVPEKDTFQAVEMPIGWGKSLGSHIVIGFGALVHYDLDNINRNISNAITTVNHQAYGIGLMQIYGMGLARFYTRGLSSTQMFADFKYLSGLVDRALGATDSWKEHQVSFGIGLMF
jgi:hypothetical protein